MARSQNASASPVSWVAQQQGATPVEERPQPAKRLLPENEVAHTERLIHDPDVRVGNRLGRDASLINMPVE